jgi:hypothetical protein
MNYATIQKTETQASYPNFSIESPKKASLVAQWFMVDGKLVCKWFMN